MFILLNHTPVSSKTRESDDFAVVLILSRAGNELLLKLRSRFDFNFYCQSSLFNSGGEKRQEERGGALNVRQHFDSWGVRNLPLFPHKINITNRLPPN